MNDGDMKSVKEWEEIKQDEDEEKKKTMYGMSESWLMPFFKP
jgi:hypothetical protein